MANVKDYILSKIHIIKDMYNSKEVILAQRDIITNQTKMINKLTNDRTLIYNKAVEKIGHVKNYRMEKFSGPQSRFWSGRYGVKSDKPIQSFINSNEWDEIVIRFESNADTYWWYFFIIDDIEEVEE